MNFRAALSYGLVLLVGLLAGASLSTGGKYQDGRLSACKDLMSVMTQMNPLLALVGGIQCVPYKGDAAIKLGDKFYSLDGKTELK